MNEDKKMEEAYERFQRLGKNYKVFFTFRGQYKSLDFFFPTAKRPSRQDVKTQLNKIFPESVLINYFEREREEDKPVVHVEGAKSFGNFIAEVSAETKSDIKRRFADRKSNKEFRAGGGYAAMDQKGQTADEVRTQGQRNFEPRKFQAPNVHNTKTKDKITYAGNPPMTFKIGEDKSDVEEGLVTGALAGAALIGGVASIMSRAKKATSKENHSDKAVGKPTLQGVSSGFRNKNAALEKARKKARGESFDPEGETIEEKSAAWTRKSGKNKEGGLNEKGRKSYEAENPGSDLKAPSKKKGNKRRASFCARMKGMKSKLTSAKTARDPDSRINKSLRAWNC